MASSQACSLPQVADTIIMDLTEGKAARLPYQTGLSACIPASAIRQFLEQQ